MGEFKPISRVLCDPSEGHRTSLSFMCPGCGHPHTVKIKGDSAWGFNGNLDKPTFTPSLLVTCMLPEGHSNKNPAPVGWQGKLVEHRCHSYVTDGKIQFLGDCTHKLAGKTINLPNWPIK